MLVFLFQDPARFILHVDATFKLNQCSFPVLVFGITGPSRRIKPVAFFVVSQRTERKYAAALRSLETIYYLTHKKPLLVEFVMGDADDAQYNAIVSEISQERPVIYLMCFYHVIAKVPEKPRRLSKRMSQDLYRRVYDIHFARSADEQDFAVKTALGKWYRNPLLVSFADYFYKQWWSGRFSRWQCYHTPVGFAKTNNPVEQFNKVVKRDHTLRTRLMVGSLIAKPSSCFLVQSVALPDKQKTHEQAKILKRTNILMKAGKLYHQIVAQFVYNHCIGQRVVMKNLHVRSRRSKDVAGVTAYLSLLSSEDKQQLARRLVGTKRGWSEKASQRVVGSSTWRPSTASAVTFSSSVCAFILSTRF